MGFLSGTFYNQKQNTKTSAMKKGKIVNSIKYLCGCFLAISSIFMLSQCKKNPPKGTTALPSDDSDSGFVSGRYIIRTKYCPNGVAYALVPASNFETLDFIPMRKEDLPLLKTEEGVIWNVEDVRAEGFVVVPPLGSNDYSIFAGYRIYKQNPADNIYQVLSMHRPGASKEDEVGDGWGENQYIRFMGVSEVPRKISAQTNCYDCTNHPGHDGETGSLFLFINNGDGGYKIRHSDREYNCAAYVQRWWLTTTHDSPDANEDCDWAQRLSVRPNIPGILVGPNVPLGLIPKCQNVRPPGEREFERCYKDDFYFEKVD